MTGQAIRLPEYLTVTDARRGLRPGVMICQLADDSPPAAGEVGYSLGANAMQILRRYAVRNDRRLDRRIQETGSAPIWDSVECKVST